MWCLWPNSEVGAVTSKDISEVSAWAYQLQNANPAQITDNESFQLIVMDYSSNGMASGAYLPAELTSIKASGKIPICYLSIGEAENYRWYWQSGWDTNPPSWLGPENPDWAGNFKVRFWEQEWQDIIFQYLHTIVDQGFAGIYLDIVDGYFYWSEEIPENLQADRDMAQFVMALGDSMRTWGGPDMLLIPQNGEYIVVEDDVEGPLAESYLAAIDAIGIEDVFFYGEADENNPWNPDTGRQQILTDFIAHGVVVLSVEYLTDVVLIQQYHDAALAAGYVPYTSVRALDVLTDGMEVTPAATAWPSGPGLKVGKLGLSGGQGLQLRVHSDWGNRHVILSVYDLRGRQLGQTSGNLLTGWNDLSLQINQTAPSGLYLYKIKTNDGAVIRGKALLIK